MSDIKKLTQEEADYLLSMLKESLVNAITFPEKGTAIEFDVIGSKKKDLFTTKIYRGRINSTKYEISARIKKDGTTLLELHVNPGKIHINPDGVKLTGSHWHIYTEKYGRKQAFLAEDIRSDNFVKNTLLFMEKFNIIEKPSINYQLELL